MNPFKKYNHLNINDLGVVVDIQKGLMSYEIVTQRKFSVRIIEKHRSNIIKKQGWEKIPNVLLRWSLAMDTKLNKSNF